MEIADRRRRADSSYGQPECGDSVTSGMIDYDSTRGHSVGRYQGTGQGTISAERNSSGALIAECVISIGIRCNVRGCSPR